MMKLTQFNRGGIIGIPMICPGGLVSDKSQQPILDTKWIRKHNKDLGREGKGIEKSEVLSYNHWII